MKGHIPLICSLVLMCMMVPLSTDMCLPALPKIAEHYSASTLVTTATVYAFFFVMAFGMLFSGPLSDRLGRKGVLVPNCICYTVSCGLCACMPSIGLLILFRMTCAFSAGCLMMIPVAIIKDVFEGKLRSQLTTITTSLGVAAPIVAPYIGTQIELACNWQAIFWFLALLGFICLVLALTMKDTTPESAKAEAGSIAETFARLGAVAKDRSFMFMLIAGSSVNGACMAYLAVSAFVYQGYFGLSEMDYSYFYGATAGLALLGPALYLKVDAKVPSKHLMTSCFAATLVSGLCLLFLAPHSLWLFFIAVTVIAISAALSRPLITNVLMKQRDTDTGSLSAWINFLLIFEASLFMLAASAFTEAPIVGASIIISASALLCLALWLLALRSPRFRIRAFEWEAKGITGEAEAAAAAANAAEGRR